MDIPEWGSLIIKVPEKLNYLNKEVATLSRVHNQPRTRKGVKGIRLVGVKDWRAVDTVQEVRPENLPPDLKRAKERADRPKNPVGRPPKPEGALKERPKKEKKSKMGRPPNPDLPRLYYFLKPAMRAIYNRFRGVPISDIPTRLGEKGKFKYQTQMFGSDLNPRQKVRSIQVYMKLLEDYPKLQEQFRKIPSGQYYTFDGTKALWDEIMWVSNIQTMESYKKETVVRQYWRGKVQYSRKVDVADDETGYIKELIPTFDYEKFRAEIIDEEEEEKERPDTPLAEAEKIELVFNEELGVWVDEETDLYYRDNDGEKPPLGQIFRGKLMAFKK